MVGWRRARHEPAQAVMKTLDASHTTTILSLAGRPHKQQGHLDLYPSGGSLVEHSVCVCPRPRYARRRSSLHMACWRRLTCVHSR